MNMWCTIAYIQVLRRTVTRASIWNFHYLYWVKKVINYSWSIHTARQVFSAGRWWESTLKSLAMLNLSPVRVRFFVSKFNCFSMIRLVQVLRGNYPDHQSSKFLGAPRGSNPSCPACEAKTIAMSYQDDDDKEWSPPTASLVFEQHEIL